MTDSSSIEVTLEKSSSAKTPFYASLEAAGADICADISLNRVLESTLELQSNIISSLNRN